jgi:hypothetical protein
MAGHFSATFVLEVHMELPYESHKSYGDKLFKVNEYFGGKVKSLAFTTIGDLQP